MPWAIKHDESSYIRLLVAGVQPKYYLSTI